MSDPTIHAALIGITLCTLIACEAPNTTRSSTSSTGTASTTPATTAIRAPRADEPVQQPGQPPILPDSVKTPGATFPVTATDVCTPGYSRSVRNVPAAEKRDVYASYGITSHAPHEYEVDHLISLELGGSNSEKNLWPESYLTQPWNAHVKDALENKLHREVCAGSITLQAAQQEISHDWIASYRKHFDTDTPLVSHTRSRSRRSSTQPNPS